MQTVFTDAAIETFGEVETTKQFVMSGRDVREVRPGDTPLAIIKAIASTDRSGIRTVIVSDHMKRTLYKGQFDVS